MPVRELGAYRTTITRVVLGYYLLFLLWRGYCHLLPFQLASPAISKVRYDPAFMLFKLSGLPGVLVHSYAGSVAFSICTIALCGLAIALPRKRLFTIGFSILFFLLAIVFNVYLCHGSHYLAGMVLMSVVFWPKKDSNFELLWEGMRYYSCWIYGSAFLWRIAMGAFFQWEAGLLTFKANLAQYIYQNPETAVSQIYYYVLEHPLLLNAGHKVVALAEGFFLLGFFTKRFDRLLIGLAVFIFLSIYFFSDVFFAELLVVIFPLVPERSWARLRGRRPAFT